MVSKSRSKKKQQNNLEQFLAEAQLEKQQLRDYVHERFAEVDDMNAKLHQAWSRLEHLLQDALDGDTYINLGKLTSHASIFSFLQKKENRDLKQLQKDFAASKEQAVNRYFNMVLTNSEYPAGFAQQAELTYLPAAQLLRISYELPTIDIIPKIKAYKYSKARDQIIEIVLSQKQRRKRYLSVLAQTSLRTIYEVFTADRTVKIERIHFEGYVDAINPSTGRTGRFCLLAMPVQREHFRALNLRLVEPVPCLRGLNAAISSKPDRLLAVPAIASDGAQDAAGSDSPAIASLKLSVNEYEINIQSQQFAIAKLERELKRSQRKVAALNAEIPTKDKRISALETELEKQKQRSAKLARDLKKEKEQKTKLGAELLAQNKRISQLENELERDRRVAQAQNVAKSSVIQTQNDSIDELDTEKSIPIDELGGAVPKAVPTDKTIQFTPQPDSEPFHPLDIKQPTDEPADISIPPSPPAPETEILLEVLSHFIQGKRANYIDYIGAKLAKLHINRLAQEGKLERHKFHRYKLRITPAGKQWYDQQINLQGASKPEDQSQPAEAAQKDEGFVPMRYQRGKFKKRRKGEGWLQNVTVMRNGELRVHESTVDSNAPHLGDDRNTPYGILPHSPSAIAIADDDESAKALRKHLYALAEEFAGRKASYRIWRENGQGADDPMRFVCIDEAHSAGKLDCAMFQMHINANRIVDKIWSSNQEANKGKQWYDQQISLQGASEPEDQSHPAEAAPKAEKTVTLGELLGGGLHKPAADIAPEPPPRTKSNVLERPAGTPDDLLTDLLELVTIMGEYGSETSRLIEKMAESDWRCSHDTLEAIFRQDKHVTFVNNIIEEINDRANEEIDNPLVTEEEGWWIIEEEFRDEIEHILKHPGYLNHKQNG